MVRQQLRNRLLTLPFPEFARCLARLLTELGYEEVQLKGATHAKGRNAYGGFDLQAAAHHGLTRSLLLAQVKQYRSPVPRAFVDELRGAMLRVGAQQGMLLTTATFSPAAHEAASSAQHALPIRLVEGEELVRLIQKYDVPVGSRTLRAARPQTAPDLSEQEDLFPPLPPESVASPPAETPLPPGVTVTLIVGVADTPEKEKARRPRK